MDLVWSDRSREYDPVIVVVLLNGGGQKTANPDPITTHNDRALVSIMVEEMRPEFFAEDGTKFEDVPYFDAAF